MEAQSPAAHLDRAGSALVGVVGSHPVVHPAAGRSIVDVQEATSGHTSLGCRIVVVEDSRSRPS